MESTSDNSSFGESLGQAAGEAEKLLDQGTDAASREVGSALKKAAQQLRRAQAEFVRLEEIAVERAKAAAQVTDDAVHEHPYAAMGLAAALGALFGMLIARR